MVNVHGHVHRNPVGFESEAAATYYTRHFSRYRRVQIEETFSPILLDDILVSNPDAAESS